MCEYCDKEDSEIMEGKQYNMLGKTFLTGVYVGEGSRDLIVEFGDERIFQGKINYCPMCGKKLHLEDAFGGNMSKEEILEHIREVSLLVQSLLK